ncbi:MAG: FAD-binding oxidoreductase [Azospirillaceae bacterium]
MTEAPPRSAAPSGHVGSWYAATANPAPERPPLEGERRCDVAVVGGGFTGLSAALELAGRGYSVTLLEAERIGWGASGRNGGQIVTGFNKTVSSIAGMVGPDEARRLWDMAEEAKALIADRVARHAIACDLRWGYFFAAMKRSHMRDLEADLAEWRGLGHDRAEMIPRERLGDYVASPRYVGGLLDRGSGQLHPLNYALGLAAAAEAAGATLFETSRVERLEAGTPAVLTTARGRAVADHVILAGNAYLPGIAPEVETRVRPRLMPVLTWIAATEPLGEDRARALIPADLAVADVRFALNYYRLSRDHRMLFGGGVSYSLAAPRDPVPLVRRKMTGFFPDLADAAIEYCWGGLIGISFNRLPDLGRVAPNIFYAQGFSGHGLALTGLAGKLMAEAVAGTAERFDVFARIPHRPFPGGRWLRTPALVLGTTWYRLRDLLG